MSSNGFVRQATKRDVRAALNLVGFDGSAAQQKMAPVPRLARRPPEQPGDARLGGVLLLLFLQDGEPHVILTRRRDDLQSHAGQVSFPGGSREASESLLTTALRETYEEIGVEPEQLTVLGRLTTLYIFPSDFEVHPYVAWLKSGEQAIFIPNPEEVAEIIELPLRTLIDPSTRREEMWNIRGFDLLVPFFEVQGHKVWGATAMMLSEFRERLLAISLQHRS